jgi:K+-sensing histidine kinase KdpD
VQNENIMVCVTQQITCERLIHYGKLFRDKINGELHIIHVTGENDSFLGNIKENEALEYLFAISNKAGADLTVLRSRNIEKTIIEFVKDNKISHIVLGENNKDTGIVGNLKSKLSDCEFHIISSNDNNW